ncbi:hypothetical protein Y5W_03001 [Alcanivorax sp. 521-1]|uniref:Secreted protein n=1 Tax=Alloalcanivorax profundimaris TaxID=2735259 RepID=A0ABS0AUA4_9GAMM|nr:hypothetical protein [Alloalcanivorax profundimaris]MBF5057707.1 hypothetical protein [Alloalcanivorax profundimaris]
MHTLKRNSLITGALGGALLLLSPLSQASWVSGACPSGLSVPCVEQDYNGTVYHFNGGHEDDWHPDANGDDFSFSGSGTIQCPSQTLDCSVNLDAQVKKFQDDQDVWRIGFKVTDASVSGGLLCSLADLSGMPWYLADSSTHDNFGNDDGVVWPGPIQGNIGTLEVLLAGSSVASNIHAHGVSYDNVDTFSLTGDLYNNGTDTAQGCSLSGDLTLDSPVNYLTVF